MGEWCVAASALHCGRRGQERRPAVGPSHKLHLAQRLDRLGISWALPEFAIPVDLDAIEHASDEIRQST
jgi:hypothetical protein